MESNPASDMVTIKHKFLSHKISRDTKILVIGTFNPDTQGNNADFFYSRQVKRPNELWKLLPAAFGAKDLTGLNRVKEKKEFMKAHNFDFIDIVEEARDPSGAENNVKDAFLDKYVTKYRDVIGEMRSLKLEAACFTRSTINGIPRMKSEIAKIEDYCMSSGIRFARLITPSPAYRSDKKQLEWSAFFRT